MNHIFTSPTTVQKQKVVQYSLFHLQINSLAGVSCIAPRGDLEEHVRISRTHTEEPPVTDWEIGLREAAHQALLRDGYSDSTLRGYLQNAPFSGKQAVKVFGDIAILARGQLYATPVGFSFVQDPYHNDCDECHNDKKCSGDKCGHFVPYGTQQLVALWTVKRIRHRDINYGYRYEIEYTISPVDRALKDGFITKNGKFDYGIPGHVFVIKSNPRYVSGYEHNEFYSSPDQVKWHRQYVPRPPSDFYPPVLITHSQNPPSKIYPSPQPTNRPSQSIQHNNNLKEIKLYRNLINSLSAKTTTIGHRFKIDPTSTTPKTAINRVIPVAQPTTTSYHITPESPRRTTLVQLPTGHIVPVTEVSTATIPDGQLQILTPIQISTGQNGNVHFVPSSPITVTEVTKYTEAGIPNQIPSTKIPIFIMKELIPPKSTSVKPEVVKDMGSTKLPKKTTIHFFAAEDVDKSVQEEKDVNDIFTITTKKYATRKEFTKPPPQQKSTKRYDDDSNDDINLFPAIKPTEAMRKVTQTPFKETNPTVNQISRPYKETSTTQTLPIIPTREQQPTFFRITTTPLSYPSTTETPSSYGTRRSTITLPIPSTFDHQTTEGNTYDRQTTPMQRNTESTSIYNYNVLSTQEPNETIITVTPVPTIPIGHTTLDDSTLTSYDYTQGRLTTANGYDYTTERREPSTDNVLSRTTLVFPSTPMGDGTTLSSRTTNTVLTQHTNTRGISTTEVFTEAEPTTESIFNPPAINTVETYYSPQTTEYHSMAYPATESVQSTTSPTTKMTTAIFKSSKTTRLATTKSKPTTQSNDFLVEEIPDEDDSVQINSNKSKFQDYTDDDIFGPSQPNKKEAKLSNYKQQPSKIYKTDFTTEPTRTVAKTPRIIYSDFFEASTVPPTTSLTQFYAESQNNYITQSLDATTQRLPLTSQSYLTSISYKVNKKKPSIADELEVLPTIRAKLSNLHSDEKLQIFRAELPEGEENTTKKSDEKEAFDDIALQLVNHARTLELLNKKPVMENKNPIQNKKNLKYRRRSYMPKSRKNNTLKPKNKKE